MAKKKKEAPKPSQPPDVNKKFQFYSFQWVGLPLILLIPILALFGLFGESVESVSTSNQQLDMSVEYPTRFRYKMIDEVTVSLSNVSEQAIPGVLVNFDRQYIEAFSTVTFTPSLKSISNLDYIMEISDLQPGETRVVTLTIQAEKYGLHRGVISTAAPGEGSDLELPVATFTFP